MALAWVVVSVLAAFPVCGGGGESAAALHTAINFARVEAGLRPLAAEPTLCDLAAQRAQEVGATGSPDVDMRMLNGLRRAVYRLGYRPHALAQSSLILNPGDRPLESWREVRPEGYVESIQGDFEHVGIGISSHEGRPVYSIVLALTQRTMEWRRVEPLTDVDTAVAEMLARVNEIRTERGRAPLVTEPRLKLAAARHARDLLVEEYYDHRGRDGSSVRDRAVAAGFSGRAALAENLAKGIFSPSEVVDRWMESSGHRKNILNPRFTRMGNGLAFGETSEGVEVVWVQMFAGPG